MDQKTHEKELEIKPRIIVGTDDFKTLRLKSNVFVDKSVLIKEIIEDSGTVILITRPRRWGKSLNMDMIQRFLEIEVDKQGNSLPYDMRVNDKLFLGGEVDLGLGSKRKEKLKKLKIAEYNNLTEEYLGQFPVIKINFKDVRGNSYKEIEAGISLAINKTYRTHEYLAYSEMVTIEEKEQFHSYLIGEQDIAKIKDSLKFLAKLLYKHFNKKSYILIDEYDTPINSSYLKFGLESAEFNLVLDLFRGIFGSSLKTNPYVEKGIITGILRVAKANLFSDLNNVREYTLLDKKFAKFYGFTQIEVEELLFKLPDIKKPEKIKDWYNGYSFGGETIYNPWSIMVCLSNKGKLDHYWIDSGGTGLVDKALISDNIQEDIQDLLEGRGLTKKLYKQVSLNEIETNDTILYSLLVFAGYLNPVLANDDDENPLYNLTIPNKEVRYIYAERVIKWVTRKLNINMGDYDNFVALLFEAKIEKFQERLGEYLMNSTSYHDLSRERDYHNLMGGLLCPMARAYMIESNKESGHGRFDHMLISRETRGDLALILEYKVSKEKGELESLAKAGLEQINSQEYESQIKQHKHIKKIIKLSIAFSGKDLSMAYQIDEI